MRTAMMAIPTSNSMSVKPLAFHHRTASRALVLSLAKNDEQRRRKRRLISPYRFAGQGQARGHEWVSFRP
jgi:hypothetical protein